MKKVSTREVGIIISGIITAMTFSMDKLVPLVDAHPIGGSIMAGSIVTIVIGSLAFIGRQK